MAVSLPLLDYLDEGISVVSAETWKECSDYRCDVKWRVTLRNTSGDELTQSGITPMPIKQDRTLDTALFWRTVVEMLSEMQATLRMQNMVNQYPRRVMQFVVGLAMQRGLDFAIGFGGQDAVYYRAMRNLSERDFRRVQELCRTRLRSM